jgi:DNA replication protein DnaC
MLNEPTLEKLRDLRLNALAQAWCEQRKDPKMTGLDFDERFGLLVDAEWIDRQNKRLARNLREAKLRLNDACIEGIDYPPRRKLDKAVIRGLASCAWVHEHHNVVITGPTGVGKTYIACALAQQACRKGTGCCTAVSPDLRRDPSGSGGRDLSALAGEGRPLRRRRA